MKNAHDTIKRFVLTRSTKIYWVKKFHIGPKFSICARPELDIIVTQDSENVTKFIQIYYKLFIVNT